VEEEKRLARNWERSVEKQIREAMERGEFDKLSGRGKPLDFGDNPYTPRDWELAFKMLKDAGVAPEWIEQDKEIRRERLVLVTMLERNAKWLRERGLKMRTLSPDKMIAEHESLGQAREQTCTRFREMALALNRQIDIFNLKVPSSRLQHRRIRIDEELSKFLNGL
jgi:hypothetical protein